jgi:4-hydroxybenzoate polyprenyltransferase
MSKLRAYCELVRLPNVFTAVAEVMAGYWLVSAEWRWTPQLGLLMVASASLYSAGIVFNDLADLEVDRAERPNRPLPSGRIPVRRAWFLAIALMLTGVLAAALSGGGRIDAVPRPAIFAIAVITAILAYNFLLKETVLGGPTMGACRVLNFCMAVSACPLVADEPAAVEALRAVVLLSLGIFLYITSLTLFGRREAGESRRRGLIAAAIGIGMGTWIIGSVCVVRSGYRDFTLVLWLALAIHLGRVTVRAIRHRSPAAVQYAMKTYILGIIAFDAVIASAAHGWPAGVAVLALLAPALLAGRWVYST